MNQKALKTLEFDKIIHRLTEHAASVGAKKKCTELVPVTSLWEIERAQTQTADALRRIWQKGSISFGGIRDIRGSIKRLEIGGILGMGELRQIMSLLETAGQVQKYGAHEREDEKADSLDESFEFLDPIPSLCSEIRRCILADDEMADDASSALFSIRRSMRQMNDKVHNTLNAMVNGAVRTYLQDAVITMRDGRYCLPVKAEHRSQVPGMIHDQSATGSTLFIEPMAVVKLNNDFKELLLKEQQEIEKILSELSEKTAAYADQISGDYDVLVELDFIFAKAILAKEMNAVRPVFNDQRRINIKEGRHPLLDPKKVVPVTVRLGDDFRLLIITGPNTGGKTVSLKTVGLFTLMGQAGLHIPAFEGSELGVFGDVFADIGDEQSIEQSLSTFSSHMTTIVSILKNMDTNSLVLFDELGAGTDPTEGAALAVSILDHLQKQGIRTMATTHYSELKVYALSTEGVENACCEFDVESLRPTYRLLIGIPGKSNAFAISSRLGLPDFLIEDAKKHLSAKDISFEDIIAELEHSRVTLEKEQMEIQSYKEEIRKLRNELQKKQENIDQRKEKLLKDANDKAAAILQEAKDYADETIKNFHKFGKANISIKDMEQQRSRLREKIDAAQSKSQSTTTAKPKKKVKADKLHIGDKVRVLSLNLEGTVSTLPNAKGDLFVQMGILRSQVNVRDLEFIGEAENLAASKSMSGSGKIRMSKSALISTEINLIGMTVDEAMGHLDKYLDDAYLAHVPSVRIVHGKGTGALRTAVQQHLKRCKYIKSYRLGTFGEGDAGVTIAEFK
ncbi:endonuclease MutS2 [Hominiventricola filiformis]|uniref:Endonuclease MutS2 n=1 Tax=Hominiventricola filiformis TaxID=2885352 RepID=A0AAE3A5J8_9FIRM|nr:endonuclease MutS2 [Hominiventricola filiformis]MCC2125859.1 endonuclease MutS2 [Hominiventricola filiformis]